MEGSGGSGPRTGGPVRFDGEWFEADDVAEWVAALVDGSRRAIGATDVGVMLNRPGRKPEVVAVSSQRMQPLMQYQTDRHEGPAIDCQGRHAPVIDYRLDGGDSAWPRFALTARAMGFRTVHALPMHLGDKVVGAFTFADIEANPLQRDDVERATSCVDTATAAILHVDALRNQIELVDELEAALESRIVIEQAKGMVAIWLQVTPDQAFGILRRHARRTQTDLPRVASSVVEGATAPRELVEWEASLDRCPAA
jgi:ANTAR domain